MRQPCSFTWSQEKMRNLYELDGYRVRGSEVRALYGDEGDDKTGVFALRSPVDGAALRIIASSGDGWDHVSVSRQNRCPNWPEMEHVKRRFFREHEIAMQLHVPPSEHISMHPHCLHLWRPLEGEIPRPPGFLVAPPGPAPTPPAVTFPASMTDEKVVARAMARFWRKFADRADVRSYPDRRENALAMAREWDVSDTM